ncbi:MAG: MFS transporter, partial [Thermoguttaceae bacterium]|nr:MFS transporter [Thermoguttaceae bacterium]
QKRTLLGCLAVWIGLLLAAFLVRSKFEFWILGGIVSMVMGGTQSVSRAIMGTMTPESRTGEFFGFFNFSGKATSFLGPNLFGWMLLLTGSARWAIASLLVFFLVGGAIAAKVNVEQGRRQAQEADQSEAPG